MLGSHEAVQRGNEVWRRATIAAPLNEAQRGVQTGTGMRVTGEENHPETPPMTGEEATENETAERTETEVRKGALVRSSRN